MMSLRSVFCLISTILLSLTQAEPQNIALLQRELNQYYDSGQYQKEVAAVIQKAEYDLSQELNKAKNTSDKLALVLDIDETALSNYSSLAKQKFGGDMNRVEQDIHAAKDPAISPTLRLYEFAKAHKMSVFFITGRREHERNLTIENLQRAGYKDWDGIYFKPEKYKEASAVPYKSSIRKRLANAGYRILANIGDQHSDLAGGYAQYSYKLPGPFYYIP
jgi:acid phosphatase